MSSFLKSLSSTNKLVLLTIISSVGAASASYFLYKKYKKSKDPSSKIYIEGVLKAIPSKTEEQEKVEENKNE